MDEKRMHQCDCGAYRIQVMRNGSWTWGAGCRACDRIRFALEDLYRARDERDRARVALRRLTQYMTATEEHEALRDEVK